MSEKLELSGASEHIKGQFDWLDSKGVHISLNMYERKTRKMFEINKLRTINERDKTFILLNRENGCESLHDKFLEISFHENRRYDVNIMTVIFVNVLIWKPLSLS